MSLPWLGFTASTEDREESEVDEAECLGESIGEAMAVEGVERSVSVVVEVIVRRRAGFWRATPLVVAEAMMLTTGRGQIRWLLRGFFFFLETVCCLSRKPK